MTRTLAFAVSLLMVSACSAHWRPVSLAPHADFSERTVIEFRGPDSVVRLHAVRVGADSVSGIPWLQHTSCDSCRLQFALTKVSSARTGNPAAGAYPLLLPIVGLAGFALFFAIALAGYSGD